MPSWLFTPGLYRGCKINRQVSITLGDENLKDQRQKSRCECHIWRMEQAISRQWVKRLRNGWRKWLGERTEISTLCAPGWIAEGAPQIPIYSTPLLKPAANAHLNSLPVKKKKKKQSLYYLHYTDVHISYCLDLWSIWVLIIKHFLFFCLCV